MIFKLKFIRAGLCVIFSNFFLMKHSDVLAPVEIWSHICLSYVTLQNCRYNAPKTKKKNAVIKQYLVLSQQLQEYSLGKIVELTH